MLNYLLKILDNFSLYSCGYNEKIFINIFIGIMSVIFFIFIILGTKGIIVPILRLICEYVPEICSIKWWMKL